MFTDDVIAQIMKPSAVGIIPTDTLYGIVARAQDPQAVARLYKIKSREHKPGTIIAASIDQLVELGIKRRYLTAVAQFWPGAVSVEIPHGVGYLNQDTGRQAFRIPDINTLVDFLRIVGPLQTSSANYPGLEPAATVEQARNTFGNNVDFYVDGGDLSGREPSTIIRVVDDAIEVLRLGAVKIVENETIDP